MTLAAVPRYELTRQTPVEGTAVVVGGSVAGLVAARVLADRYDDVVVLDRDPLPDEPVARRGVPQARAPHVLWEAGRATLEDLFPGYAEEVIAGGGLMIDALRDMRVFSEGDFVAPGPTRQPMLCASRPLFEQVVRRRVATHPGITVRERCQVTDYRYDETAGTVTGVEVRPAEGEGLEEFDAELVVDATGRTSRTPVWLKAHGYEAPPTDEVTIDVAYSVVVLERSATDRRAFVNLPEPPSGRGLFTFPIERDRRIAALAGVHGDHPPTDPDELLAFAETLDLPEARRLLEEQPWVSEEVFHYPYPANRRNRYETLEAFPKGLVVVGDAIASYNPVYGQGMSVAALQGLVLHHALAEGGREDLAHRFFEDVTSVVEPAWMLAVGADFQFDETTGPKPRGTDLINRYFARLFRSMHTDGSLSGTFNRVVSMQDPPSILFRPGVIWRVMRPRS